MSRIDRIITMRVAAHVFAVIIGFFILILLFETLDRGRFNTISARSGDMAAYLAAGFAAIRWSIKTLSVTVLIGGVLGMLSLQRHREFVVMKASGLSIWQLLRGPTLFSIALGLSVTLGLEAASTSASRQIYPLPHGNSLGIASQNIGIWLPQVSENGPYILTANFTNTSGTELGEVIIFPQWENPMRRITADSATFDNQKWILANPTISFESGNVGTPDQFEISSISSVADLRLQIGSTLDFTFYDLVNALRAGITDPVVYAAAQTRMLKLMSLPLLLVGSLLIAFAFSSGYRRMNNHGYTVVYGIILGFVVFVITEMAELAGSAGVFDPVLATWGPALVSVLVGLSFLLRTEDGLA